MIVCSSSRTRRGCDQVSGCRSRQRSVSTSHNLFSFGIGLATGSARACYLTRENGRSTVSRSRFHRGSSRPSADMYRRRSGVDTCRPNSKNPIRSRRSKKRKRHFARASRRAASWWKNHSSCWTSIAMSSRLGINAVFSLAIYGAGPRLSGWCHRRSEPHTGRW